MQVFLAVLVLAAGCFADEVFEVVDSLDSNVPEFRPRSDFQSFEFAAPAVEYAPPVVTYAPPVVTYAPRRTAPPVTYGPPRTQPPVTYAPPRTLPPVTYAPPKPVYGEPPAHVEFAAPVVAEPFSAPPRFDLTVVDNIPSDSFRTLNNDHFVGRPLRPGSHEYVSPDGVPVSIKFH